MIGCRGRPSARFPARTHRSGRTFVFVSVPAWQLTQRRDVDLRRVASALCR
ncbi:MULTISPECIES: putative leader peptide [Cellulosimicrobium]|uniref:Leader peptide n=1 Tax=Cellulosimicrobium sp. ES-005 TaxID=3163031 RepID=A0AAU8FZ99_9MICO